MSVCIETHEASKSRTIGSLFGCCSVSLKNEEGGGGGGGKRHDIHFDSTIEIEPENEYQSNVQTQIPIKFQ